QYLVMDAGLRALDGWINGGPPPPSGDPLVVQNGRYVLDDHGNTTGGIRLPEVVAPVAVSSGLGNTGGVFCMLFGSNTPFDPAVVKQLYPTHDAYVQAYSAALDQLQAKGFAIARDVAQAKTLVQHSTVAS